MTAQAAVRWLSLLVERALTQRGSEGTAPPQRHVPCALAPRRRSEPVYFLPYRSQAGAPVTGHAVKWIERAATREGWHTHDATSKP